MIPKIIHYIWLGNQPIPTAQKTIIEDWRRFLPDYQFYFWGNDTLNMVQSAFVEEACSVGKWAFATDYIRLWALYQYGGIYIDTDVVLKQSFDSLLNHSAFIGRENCLQIRGRKTEYDLTSFCLGAEKEHPFIQQCLEYYSQRHFILSDGESLPPNLKWDMRNASEIYARMASLSGYKPSALSTGQQETSNGLTIIPWDIFSQYCSHLSQGSWREAPLPEIDYSFRYKISWRIRHLVSKMLGWFDYIMVKLK